MSVLVVGISHNSAPVSLLERVALDPDGAHEADPRRRRVRARHRGDRHLRPATGWRSTPTSTASTAPWRRLSRLLVDRAGRSTETLLPHLYVHYDDGAVSHLFQVAAGLDSMAVGEGQILGQTREALRLGQELGTVGPSLNVLFQQALRVGKRSRAETDIDRAAPSLVSAALDRSGLAADGLAGRRVLVVGAGAMAGPGHRDRGPARRFGHRRRQPQPRATPTGSPSSTPPARCPCPTWRPSSAPPTWW